jgi:hypothetical protein
MTIRTAFGAVILGSSLVMLSAPANASTLGLTQSAVSIDQDLIVQVARRSATIHVNRSVKVNRGATINRNFNVNRNVKVNRNIYVNRPVNVRRGLYSGRYVYRGGPWVRPRNYWWPVGGAIAAGAAIGLLTAATATAYAGPAPGPQYCWYYTDPSRTQGFWDLCP